MMTVTLDIVTTAALLFVVATGLLVIFGVLKIINFAHGAFLTVGAYGALATTAFGLNPWLSFPLAFVAGAVVGLLVERLVGSAAQASGRRVAGPRHLGTRHRHQPVHHARLWPRDPICAKPAQWHDLHPLVRLIRLIALSYWRSRSLSERESLVPVAKDITRIGEFRENDQAGTFRRRLPYPFQTICEVRLLCADDRLHLNAGNGNFALRSRHGRPFPKQKNLRARRSGRTTGGSTARCYAA